MTRDGAAPFECTRVAIDQSASSSLIVPLAVTVLDILTDDLLKVAFTVRNHLADSFRLRRSKAPLGTSACVQKRSAVSLIRTTARRPHRPSAAC